MPQVIAVGKGKRELVGKIMDYIFPRRCRTLLYRVYPGRIRYSGSAAEG